MSTLALKCQNSSLGLEDSVGGKEFGTQGKKWNERYGGESQKSLQSWDLRLIEPSVCRVCRSVGSRKTEDSCVHAWAEPQGCGTEWCQRIFRSSLEFLQCIVTQMTRWLSRASPKDTCSSLVLIFFICNLKRLLPKCYNLKYSLGHTQETMLYVTLAISFLFHFQVLSEWNALPINPSCLWCQSQEWDLQVEKCIYIKGSV